MKTEDIVVKKYEADEGKVFDYAEPRFVEDENGEQVQEHLNAKVLYLGKADRIENYVEVDDNGDN